MAFEHLEDRTVLSATAMMLGQQIDLPDGLTPAQISSAQQAISAITTGGSSSLAYAASEESYQLIGVDDIAANPLFSEFDGSGQAIAILDTGIQFNIPDWGPDSDGDGIPDRIVFDWDFFWGDDHAADDHGHGSHVAGIAAGAAPGADLIVLKVLGPDGKGPWSAIEQALQWVVQNAATYNIASVNMSIGDSLNYGTEQTLHDLDNELAAINSMNISTTVSAGNRFFPWQSIPGVAYPAADPSVIAVGATYDADIGSQNYSAFPDYGNATDFTTDADRITSFSQRHPTLTDLFAPGAEIVAAGFGGSGTSMAAPHVAAAVAIAQQVSEQLNGSRLTQNQIVQLFQDTGVEIIDGDDENDNVTSTGATFKRLDVLAAVESFFAPVVTDVIISGSQSTHEPYSFAEAFAQGTPEFQTVPVGGADSVSIEFSEEVVIAKSHLTLWGQHTQQWYDVAGSTFTYDPQSLIATWTFPGVFPAEKFVISLSDDVVDLDGRHLNGNFMPAISIFTSPPSLLISGDADDGDDFMFTFVTLPGDYDLNNIVDGAGLLWWQRQFDNGTDNTFEDGDFDGDGDVDEDDLDLWEEYFGLDFQTYF